MRNNILLCSILLLIVPGGFSQTATSVANGNWMNPLTWNCTCVPLPGYSVTINHSVALDTSWMVPSGSITINPGGSLIKNNPTRDILVNGGSLTNKGILDIRYLFTQTGSFSNSGTLTARSFLNYINFTNSGTIQNVDSIYSTGVVINTGSFLNIDSITTGGAFTNNGVCTYNQFTNLGQYTNNNNLTFTDITNLGTFTNSDTMTALNSGWNAETWTNNTGAFFLVSNSFLNGDSIQHNAVLNNNGRMVVNDSWYNADTIKGVTGSFQVADTSINWGWMKQSFDFCDLTPPASAPFIDFNTGTIAAAITWCQYNEIPELPKIEIKIFPNPASTQIYFDDSTLYGYTVALFDLSGKQMNTCTNTNKIDVSKLSAGMYFLQIISETTISMNKLLIEK